MNNDQGPTLTVGVPNYNHAHYIKEALGAIINQSYKPLELLIIDDGSTDNSVEVIEEIIKNVPYARLIKNEKNMGILYTYNKLVSLAKGDYYVGASADDKVLPGFFEKSMTMLKKYPQAGMCSTLSYLMDEFGKNLGLSSVIGIASTKPIYISPGKARKMLKKNGLWVAGNTPIFRIDVLRELGGLRPELHCFADAFVAETNVPLKYGACYIPEPLASFRSTGGEYLQYSMICKQDPEIYKELIDNVIEITETEFKGLYPEGFWALWRKKNLFFLNYYQVSMAQRKLSEALTISHEPQTPVERILYTGFHVVMRIEKFFAMLYLFLYLRYLPIQVVKRNIMAFFRKRILRLKGINIE